MTILSESQDCTKNFDYYLRSRIDFICIKSVEKLRIAIPFKLTDDNYSDCQGPFLFLLIGVCLVNQLEWLAYDSYTQIKQVLLTKLNSAELLHGPIIARLSLVKPVKIGFMEARTLG